MAKRRDNSLQDVLRARRGVSSLLTPEELRQREAARKREEEARRRDEVAAEAARLVQRRRERGTRIDSEGRLATDVYLAVFAVDAGAYLASAHWARRTKAQLAHAAACERCGATGATGVRHLAEAAIGEERAGHDLVTLCDGCDRRARRRARELGRPLTRAEVRELDPSAPLYDADAIAALRSRYLS
jgi:hypothetical protein